MRSKLIKPSLSRANGFFAKTGNQSSHGVQAKFEINKPGDQYEAEADKTAEHAGEQRSIESILNGKSTMSGPDFGKPLPIAIRPTVSSSAKRKDEEVQEKNEENVQLKESEIATEGMKNTDIGEEDPIRSQEVHTKGDINIEKQRYLKKEFEIYYRYKLEIIEREENILPFEQKKTQAKEGNRQHFMKLVTRFLNRMEGNKNRFWGTERYDRLINKWFPDYEFVINHKVSFIKNTIDDTLKTVNHNINEIITTIKEAVLIADTDIAKSFELLEISQKHLSKGNEEKKKSLKILAGYGEEHRHEYMKRYDEVLSIYSQLIRTLTARIATIAKNKTQFNVVIDELSTQQSLLLIFKSKISATNDVQMLISLQENEFDELISLADKTVKKVSTTDHNTTYLDEAAMRETIDFEDKKISILGAEVDMIRQAEIKRRKEEQGRNEEEARKKTEAEQRKREQEQSKTKSSNTEEHNGFLDIIKNIFNFENTSKSNVTEKKVQWNRLKITINQNSSTQKKTLIQTVPTEPVKNKYGYDINKAVDALNQNAQPKSIGYCARYVRMAIEAGGISTEGRPGSATDYDDFLPKKGFTAMSSGDYVPVKGDIVVLKSFVGKKNHPHGHIQMYNGTQWVSDFKQKDFWPGSDYRNSKPRYIIFRWQ